MMRDSPSKRTFRPFWNPKRGIASLSIIDFDEILAAKRVPDCARAIATPATG